jgi:hypothetical protein
MFYTQFNIIHCRREVHPQSVDLKSALETSGVIFVTFAGPQVYAMRFEVLLAVSMKIAVFWDVAQQQVPLSCW